MKVTRVRNDVECITRDQQKVLGGLIREMITWIGIEVRCWRFRRDDSDTTPAEVGRTKQAYILP